MTENSRSRRTRFHPNHGRNIILYEDNTVAYRKASFSNALVFSEEPLQAGEIFLLEVEREERGWSGYMRMGLTSLDPDSIDETQMSAYVTALPHLVERSLSWVFAMTRDSNVRYELNDGDPHPRQSSLHGENGRKGEQRLQSDGVNVQTSRGIIPFSALRPNIVGSSKNILTTDPGSRIGIMYVPQAGSDRAEMHFILNGEDQGVSARDIPYKERPLHVVVDVYGMTRQVRIVQLYNASKTLQSACRQTILQCTKRTDVDSLPLPKMLKEYLLSRLP